MLVRAWTSPATTWVASALALLGVLAVVRFADLSPRVQADFFFAEDDPQMRAARDVAERFPSRPQVVVRVEDHAGDRPTYRERVGRLADDLVGVPGIVAAYSIATEDLRASPLFRRILLTPDSAATNVVLTTDGTDPELLLPRLEEIVARYESPDMGVILSGVPVIVERIRRSLHRDLIVFSAVAVLVFGLMLGLVYRDAAIVVGTLATCFLAVSLTLGAVSWLGVPIGLLTANLVTIVFVLTLSHVVFLTANWRRVAAVAPEGGAAAVLPGVRDTVEASAWSMATTLLGFLSLLLATARPLQDLGIAGAVGSVSALLMSYVAYPPFLARAVAPTPPSKADPVTAPKRTLQRRLVPVGMVLVAVVVGFGVLRLETDPGLPGYFAEGTELREGLETIDRDGGSSPLDIVVRDQGGERVDAAPVFERLESLQDSLEADPAVGTVLSPAALVGHARTFPLAGLLSPSMLLDLASRPEFGGVALEYVASSREEARFFLRMREAERAEPRGVVLDRLRERARRAGFEPVLMAGLYDLQEQLARLIESSLRLGIGGLLILFLGVALAASRSSRTSVSMWVCLFAIPAVVLGAFGHLGVPMDIITSPAANVALAMGADSMIHLVVRVRALARSGESEAWARAVAQVRGPVLSAAGIVSAGFGIFALSSFPPTRRFGAAVILGMAAATATTLLLLPALAEPKVARRPEASAAV